MTTNFLQVEGQLKSDIFKTYGITIIPPKKMGCKTLYGLYNEDFSFSTSMITDNAPLTGLGTKVARGAVEGAGNAIGNIPILKKLGLSGVVSGLVKQIGKDAIGESIAESIQIYKSSEGKIGFSVKFFVIPGMFDTVNYDDVIKFITRGTLAKPISEGASKIIQMNAPTTQYLYDALKTKANPVLDLDAELFQVTINNILEIPGGLYLKSGNARISNDRDEEGNPVFIEVNLTFEFYRNLFADEYAKFFKVKTAFS